MKLIKLSLVLLAVTLCVHLALPVAPLRAQDAGPVNVAPRTNTVTHIPNVHLSRQQTQDLIAAITITPAITNIVHFDPATAGKFKVLVYQINPNGTSDVAFR